MVPLFAFMSVVLWRYAVAERVKLEQVALDEARELAQAVDGELNDLLSSAQILASMPSLREGRLDEFQRQAAELNQRLGTTAVLRSPEGQQLVHPLAPFGRPLPKIALADDQQILETGRPRVSDYFVAPVVQAPMFSAIVPVLNPSGEPIYLLSLALSVERLRNLLMRSSVPQGWVVAVVDRSGVIMARNMRHDEFVGKPATANLQENTLGREGTWEGLTADGQSVFGAFARSSLSGWRVAIGVQWSELTAPLQRTLSLLSLTALFVLMLSGVLAWSFGRRLSLPIRMLARSAAFVGQGGVVRAPRTPIRDLRQVGEALAAASMQLKRREEALRESEENLRLAIVSSRMAVWDFDVASDTIVISPELNQMLGFPRDAEPTLDDVRNRYAPGELERIRRELARAVQAGERYLELDVACVWPDGQRRWLEYRGNIHYEAAGKASRIVGVLLDVTDRRTFEEHQQLLIHELNHRVKNTLATVQSITSQSLRGAQTPRAAQETIEARLFALSRVHNILTRENWEGADLREIVREAIEPYQYVGENRFRLEGVNVRLTPRMALPLAMTLHELATNAIKYGALSNSEGVVRIQSGLTWTSDPPNLQLIWTESDGPPVATPTRRGFGSKLIERSIAWELGGEVVLDYRREGLVCTMNAPLGDASGGRGVPAPSEAVTD